MAKKKQGKKKKDESISTFKKRSEKGLITDTSPNPMICDTDNSDAPVVLETSLGGYRRSDSIVFSMRMRQDILEHFKQLAREKSVSERRDVSYQGLITEAALKTYPMEK